VRFHIYTIVGEVTSSSAWKMILKGADGVVFVADSASDRLTENQECLNNLQKTQHNYGKSLSDMPVVLQCNKRDLPAVLSLEEMQKALSTGNCPVIPAVASKGEGVLESLYSLMKTVLNNLRENGPEQEKESEHLGCATTDIMGEKRDEPRGTEPVSYPSIADSHAISAGAGDTDVKESTATIGKDDIVGKPLLELAGEPELMAGGQLLLPLNFKYGDWEKKITITVSVSLEPDQAH
jgi:predicted GTPase